MQTQMFFWTELNKAIYDEHGDIKLTQKPVFSFPYDEITYDVFSKSYKAHGRTIASPLTDKMIEEIDKFIVGRRASYGLRKLCVDQQGYFLGFINPTDSRVFKIVDSAPFDPETEIYNFETNKYDKIYYYNAAGKLVTKQESVGYTKLQPPSFYNDAPVFFNVEGNIWLIDDETKEFEKLKIKQMLSSIYLFLIDVTYMRAAQANTINNVVTSLINNHIENNFINSSSDENIIESNKQFTDNITYLVNIINNDEIPFETKLIQYEMIRHQTKDADALKNLFSSIVN